MRGRHHTHPVARTLVLRASPEDSVLRLKKGFAMPEKEEV